MSYQPATAPNGKEIVDLVETTIIVKPIKNVSLGEHSGIINWTADDTREQEVPDVSFIFVDAASGRWRLKDLIIAPSPDRGPHPEDLIPDHPINWGQYANFADPKVSGTTQEGFIAIWDRAAPRDPSWRYLVLRMITPSLWLASIYRTGWDGEINRVARREIDTGGFLPPSLKQLGGYAINEMKTMREGDEDHDIDHIPELGLFGADVFHAGQ